jgi:hypothetical protein
MSDAAASSVSHLTYEAFAQATYDVYKRVLPL